MSRSDFLRDICDGDQFKDHILQSHHGPVLQVIAYFDEVEVCNPLGSHSKVHKLGNYYFNNSKIAKNL